jgi:RHS repeat-associated protein
LERGWEPAGPGKAPLTQAPWDQSPTNQRPPDEARRDDFRLQVPAINLPKGGGAIKGIDEELSVTASSGTAALSISLPFTPARNGSKPPVRLRYDSGTGNSVVGLGWSLDCPSVRRRTDPGIPTYGADDTFSLGGAQELVPASRWTGADWVPDVDHAGNLTIRRYRPRVEADFSRIERIDSAGAGGTWWRVTTRDNVTTFYGVDDATRISDPAAPARVFEWLPAMSFDDQGNCVEYTYVPENLDGVPDALCDANRRRGWAPFTNRHLKRVRYGNRVPYAPDPTQPYSPAGTGAFLFELVVDFGEHDADHPTPDAAPGAVWPARADPFSTYRSGFEIRTCRLVRRLLMFHRFDELDTGQPSLVSSLDLTHQASTGGPGPAEATYLTAITRSGYLSHDGVYARESMPAVEFQYEPLRWDTEIRSVDAESAANLPAGASPPFQWADLFSEGISGIITEQSGTWLYKANLGDVDEVGLVRFDAQRPVAPRPSFSGMAAGVLQLQDLEADGRKQVVVQSPGLRGFWELDGDGRWQPFDVVPDAVGIQLLTEHARMLDLVGDGRADVLVIDQDELVWFRSEGRRGYEPARRVAQAASEERGPVVVFADAVQSIFLADMSGDGLTDIVRIRNGEICYWPNLGYGRFGPRVAMDNAPVFDHPDQYHPRLVHLADLSGTGAADVLYLGRRVCLAYSNLSGNAWSEGHEITPPFPASSEVHFSTTDLLGNGTACLVWSSSLPSDAGAPMRYVDVAGGRKPHLLTGYVNNLGKEAVISYKSSTWHYLADKRAGRRWITRLAFPVHCVRRVEVRDHVSGARRSSEYRYRHGYYDTTERKFGGFGMVEQLDAEHVDHWSTGADHKLVDASVDQAPVRTRTWYHTGAHDDRPEILTRLRDEHWDAEMRRQGFTVAVVEPALPDARLVARPGTQPGLADHPDPELRRQALWACRGMVLRTEVFGLDAPLAGATPAQLQSQLTPYSVATRTCLVELLQPPDGPAPAVFGVQESETIALHYERDPSDPRIEHRLNVRVDELGNVLESATVVYGRTQPDPALPDAARAAQARTRVVYTRNEFTVDAVDQVAHRLRRTSRATTFEIRGLAATVAPLYQPGDFDRPAFNVLTGSVERPFWDQGDPPAGAVWRRMLSRRDTLFYGADVQAPLARGDLHFRALPYESYELATTADLLTHTYGTRVADPVLIEGHYVLRDGGWWVASGRLVYLDAGETAAAAASRFFVPVAHVDGCGARTAIRYFGPYALLQSELEDAAGNVTRVTDFDLRTLSPRRVVDPNDNVSEVLLDELGRVKASAVLGKGGEADALTGLSGWSTPAEDAATAAFLGATASTDLLAASRSLLQAATARFVYDFQRFVASGGTLPAGVATIVREQHAAVDPNGPVHVSFDYANGSGGIELTKVPAEPGVARQVAIAPDGTVTVTQVDTRSLVPPQLRWLGRGRRVLNNKGSVVKEYEPFFSTTHRFESDRELVESGVTRISYYDPVGRLARTVFPDATFSRVERRAWSIEQHDRNDTVLESDWYVRRVNRLIDAELVAAGKDPAREQEAAYRTAPHAHTPFTRHVDPLAQALVDVQHDGFAGSDPILFSTVFLRDVSGRPLAIVDPLGNTTITYEHDMRGAVTAHASADGGHRWTLDNAAGDPLRAWDDRTHQFVFAYDDPLHRSTSKRVIGGDGDVSLDNVYERTIYGEGRPNDRALNLRTRVAVLYDTAGRVENGQFDFKGNLLASSRRFCTDYRSVPNWPAANPDAALDNEVFTSTGMYDALDRVSERTTADGTVYRPTYNAANLLDTVQVTQDGSTEVLLEAVDYDEQGRRERVVLGNGVTASYAYDPETFRLVRLTARTAAGPLQDLQHTYDPSGNLLFVQDACVPAVWFGNQMVTGLATYRYDPLYRVQEATGREHIGQVGFGAADNWNDLAFVTRYAPGDLLAWRNYTQTYTYDAAGNLQQLAHAASGGAWTRDYHYAAGSNRLESTAVGGTTFGYSHNAHGHVSGMPHLSLIRWNFRDELEAVATQVVNAGTPETTWYVYDGHGRRVRKVTDGASAGGSAAALRTAEHLYLDGVELHRQYDSQGQLTAERQTLEVRDDRQQIALVERDRPPGGGAGPRLVRYQSANQLASSTLETDETGRVLSYEEYHPFGTTAYQATDKTIAAAAKRYRYTGMERDAESGLEYHGARFYAPWLGRWIAPDTHPDKLDGNRYAYVKNNPVVYADRNGRFEEPVHGALTYRLALAAGFTEQEAARIALADAGMDHDADHRPGDDMAEMQSQILSGRTHEYHYPNQEEALVGVQSSVKDLEAGKGSLEAFGRHLHSLQDVGYSDAPGPHNRSSLYGLPLATFGVAAVAGGLGALSDYLAHRGLASSSRVGQGFGVAAAVLAVAFFAFAAYAMLFTLTALGQGHPSYATERSLERSPDGSPAHPEAKTSQFFRHTADQAFADPEANTKELTRTFDELKAAAKATGHAVPKDADAQAARAIKQAVQADTPERLYDLFYGETRDAQGNRVKSYGEVRAGAPWADRPPDATLDNGDQWWKVMPFAVPHAGR